MTPRAPDPEPAQPPMTGGQAVALRGLGRAKGLDAAALDREARAVINKPVAELTADDARELIAHLQRL